MSLEDPSGSELKAKARTAGCGSKIQQKTAALK